MRRDTAKKLKLRKHTLRRLDAQQLGRVVGGSWGGVGDGGDGGDGGDPPPWSTTSEVGRSATGSALC